MSEQITQLPQATIPVLPEENCRYFNGFAIATTPGDIVITLIRNGAPTLTLNASYTVIKTLGTALLKQIETLEDATNHSILKVEDIASGSEAYAKLKNS